jgi:hypothetical protein
MTIAKQQGEVIIHAHLVAANTEGTRSSANLTLVIDEISLDGVELSDVDLVTTYSTQVGNIGTAAKAMYVAAKSL